MSRISIDHAGSETRPHTTIRRIPALSRRWHHQARTPGTRMLGGKYPVVTGLEHDEMGHPTGRPRCTWR